MRRWWWLNLFDCRHCKQIFMFSSIHVKNANQVQSAAIEWPIGCVQVVENLGNRWWKCRNALCATGRIRNILLMVIALTFRPTIFEYPWLWTYLFVVAVGVAMLKSRYRRLFRVLVIGFIVILPIELRYCFHSNSYRWFLVSSTFVTFFGGFLLRNYLTLKVIDWDRHHQGVLISTSGCPHAIGSKDPHDRHVSPNFTQQPKYKQYATRESRIVDFHVAPRKRKSVVRKSAQ